jgi:hypothetical protein
MLDAPRIASLTVGAAFLALSLLPAPAAAAPPHPCRVGTKTPAKIAMDYRKAALAIGAACSKAGGDCAGAQATALGELEALAAAHQDLLTACGAPPPPGGGGTGGLVLNEIDYDQAGNDTAEFVEIFNASSSPVVLDGLAVVFFNGAPNPSPEYLRVALSGTLPAGGYAVVATPGVTVPPGTLTFALPAAGNNIQNGGPDAVGLVDTATGAVIDFLSYEGLVTSVRIGGSLVVSVAPELSTPLGDADEIPGSLIRLPNGSNTGDAIVDWRFTRTPTPGAPNDN